MPETTSTSIEIPLSIAARYHLTGIPTAVMRLLLVAESERPPGERMADIPAARARALAGMTGKTLYESVQRMARLTTRFQASNDDMSQEVEALRVFAPFSSPPRMAFDGMDERVRVWFSDEWVNSARGSKISIPLEEIQSFRLRAGLLLRLRAGAMVHRKPTGRLRVLVRDLPMLTGHGDLKAVEHWHKHVVPGFADFDRVSTTVRIDGIDAVVTPTHRVQAVVIRATRLEQRSARANRDVDVGDRVHVPF